MSEGFDYDPVSKHWPDNGYNPVSPSVKVTTKTTKKTNNPFKQGDIVRRVNGSSPIEVTSPTSEYIYGNYVRSAHTVHCEHHSRFTMYEEGEETMATLYEIKQDGNTTFGTKLAVNSAGQWVMEEKGTNRTLVVDKANVEEVMPYTVDIMFKDSGINYSFTSEAGKFAKGDVILMNSTFGDGGFTVALVVAVDTKAKKATKELKPLAKLVVDTNV